MPFPSVPETLCEVATEIYRRGIPASEELSHLSRGQGMVLDSSPASTFCQLCPQCHTPRPSATSLVQATGTPVLGQHPSLPRGHWIPLLLSYNPPSTRQLEYLKPSPDPSTDPVKTLQRPLDALRTHTHTITHTLLQALLGGAVGEQMGLATRTVVLRPALVSPGANSKQMLGPHPRRTDSESAF